MRMKVWNMLTEKQKKQLWTALVNEYEQNKYMKLQELQSA